MQEICVYFENNQKARLPGERVAFVRDILNTDCDIIEALEAGTIYVNWDHVCYVRRKEAENDSE